MRGHPVLTDRQPLHAQYVGKEVLILDDVELDGRELYQRDLRLRGKGSDQSYAVSMSDKFAATFYAQVCLSSATCIALCVVP